MPSWVHHLLTWLLFLAVYLGIPVPLVGDPKFPTPIAGLAAAILLLINFKNVRIQHLRLILALLIICLTSIALRAYTLPEMSIHDHLIRQLTSWVILIYAISIGYAAYLELIQWNQERSAQMLHILTLAILVGATLEVFVPSFKTLSDTFRHAVFERGLYSADLRDMHLYGAVRPKLFTSEPSHLAKYFVLFSVGWLFITRLKRKYLWFFGYAAFGMFLIRSPIVLISPVVGLISFLFSKEEKNIYQRVLLMFALLALLTPFTLPFLDVALIPRLQLIQSGRDGSFNWRFLAPLHVMINVISDYPVLGLGFGAKEIAFPYMKEVMSGLHQQVTLIHLGNNFIFLTLIQLGLAGFAGFMFILWRMMVVFAENELFLVVITMFGFMNSLGSPNSVMIWFFFFVLCAIMYARDSHTYLENTGPTGLARAPLQSHMQIAYTERNVAMRSLPR